MEIDPQFDAYLQRANTTLHQSEAPFPIPTDDVDFSSSTSELSPARQWALNGLVVLSVQVEEELPLLVLLWALGVAGLSVRVIIDWRRIRRLVASAHEYNGHWTQHLAGLAGRLGLRGAVGLFESFAVDVPIVIGWLRPIILVPPSFFCALPPGQIEAILAHELAHIRRHDYLVNLIQILIETVFFYHPAVWWIGQRIREERENCCDDSAILAGGDRVAFASALARLAESTAPVGALSASGGNLLRRVRRILGISDPPVQILSSIQSNYGWLSIRIALTALLFAGCVTGHHFLHRFSTDQTLAKALVASVRHNNLYEMLKLLHQGANPNLNVVPTGNDALFVAAASNNIPATKLLLKNGANPNSSNASGIKPLVWVLDQGNRKMGLVLHQAGAGLSQSAWAAAMGDLRTLKKLADEGTLKRGDIDEPMKFAVSMGHLEIVQFLERFNGRRIAGKFLSQAASAGNVAMMDYIVQAGADLKTDGSNALDQAVIFFDQPAAIKYLLDHGVDPNRFSPWQQYTLGEATSAATVKALLEGGANPNVSDIFGTPLSRAPDAESVRLLIQYGAKVNQSVPERNAVIESVIDRDLKDPADVVHELIHDSPDFSFKESGIHALAVAAEFGQFNTVKLLLGNGATPDGYFRDPGFDTSALSRAAYGPSSSTVKELLKVGAKSSGETDDTITPSSWALINGNWSSAKLLRQSGSQDVSDLSIAAAAGNIEAVKNLLAEGEDVNHVDTSGYRPLFYAIRRGQVATTRLLLARGATETLSKNLDAQAFLKDLQRSPRQIAIDWNLPADECRQRIIELESLLSLNERER